MACDGFLSWSRQFGLLLWKNAVIQIRRKAGTALEIILPCVFIVILIITRYQLYIPTESCSIPTTPFPLQVTTFEVFYSPNNTQTNSIISRTGQILNNPAVTFTGLSNEADLLSKIRQLQDGDTNNSLIYAGVVFPDSIDPSSTDISITIRQKHEVGNLNTWETSDLVGKGNSFLPRSTTSYTDGFLQLQNALSFAVTEWKLESNGVTGVSHPDVVVQLLPFPKFTFDVFLSGTIILLPILLVLGYIYSAGVFTQELVLEKESRLRESMKMMGLKSSALFSAWFVKQFLFMMITAVILTFLIKFGIFPNSDFFIIFFLMVVFVISFIAYGFFMSSFFSSAKLSLFAAIVVWFVLIVPYIPLATDLNNLPLGTAVGVCLFSNTCFGLAINFFAAYEGQGSGVTWTNAATPISNENALHLGIVFGMLFLDIVLYVVVAWYKEAVFPGEYGVPKPFYFPFLPSYWLGRPLRKKRNSPSPDNELGQNVAGSSNFEQDPTGIRCGIKIRNLTKVYKSLCRKQKLAVNDLSLNMYEGQITALLGHNGAGKTTTMSVLTGLYTPTSGDAVINGYSILTDMDEIRKSLGLCPQHDVLFDRLTVKEHLMLFGMLKGGTVKKLNEEIKDYLSDLQLEDKLHVAASELSGGMKRKLSVAIALIGGSRFVILDEPTSGMDPYARRAIWNLLSKHKSGRTILLTTHYMDEADILGDRIAIMAEGKLLTSGTPLFLKSRFGVGYHLTVVKGRNYDSNAISDLVTSTVEGSEKSGDVAGELSFVLPSNHIHQYPALFDKLEADKESLGIASYGVSATTIEEVFLRIMKGVERGHFDAEILRPPPKRPTILSRVATVRKTKVDRSGLDSVDHTKSSVTYSNDGTMASIQFPSNEEDRKDETLGENVQSGNQNGDQSGNRDVNETTDGGNKGNENQTETPRHPDIDYLKDVALNTGVRLWVQQFRAMAVKRAINTFRNLGNIISQLILPSLLFLFSLVYVKTIPDPNVMDQPITLTLPVTSTVSDIVMDYGDFRTLPGNQYFNSLDASLLQVSSLLNITQDVYDIQQEVIVHNDSSLCCDYNEQLLDNYCLSIDSGVYTNNLSNCQSNPTFAYSRCLQCLSNTAGCTLPPLTPTDPIPTGPIVDVTMRTYITELFLRLGAVDFVNFVQNHQVAITTHDNLLNPGTDLFTVWSNNLYFHNLPAALSTFHNLYLNYLLEVNNITTGQARVTFTNAPLPRVTNGFPDLTDRDFVGFILAIFLTLPIVFLLSGFTLSLVEESNSKSKHLQFVSGVRISSYWIANLVWDFAIVTFNVVVICVLVAVFQITEFAGVNFLAFFLLLVLVLWTGIPMMYCLSFLFTSSLLAFSSALMLLYFIAVGMLIVINDVAAGDLAVRDILHYISLIVPSYSFGAGIQSIYVDENRRTFCPQLTVCTDNIRFTENIFSLNPMAIGPNLIALAAEGVVWWILTFFVVNSFFVKEGRLAKLHCQHKTVKHKRRNAIRRTKTRRNRTEDSDVERERIRVGDMRYIPDADRDLLTVADIVKWYEGFFHKLGLRKFLSKRKLAVNHLSIGIQVSECFGLLGVNGAGKTTTFKILTGDLKPTNGTAFIAGEDIRRNIKGAQQHLGYCPQFDALLERMTGEELLTMFCRLRGIPEKTIPFVVKTEIKRLDLEKYAKKRCGTYSGGNKRKLSVGLALVGGPPILLMDEPTTGMDPKSRRKVWEVLSSAVSCGRSVVLSSHSMEECEALCTRLAIMVNGEFKCLGSVQHLKSKFGSGYTLTMKAVQDPSRAGNPLSPRRKPPPLKYTHSLSTCSFTVSRIEEPVFNSVFPGATILEEHDGYATINLPSEGLPWSAIFSKLEEHKEYLGIENYSVSQTTLEQVFLSLAKYQHEPTQEATSAV